jgi:hypothetical protein
MMDELRNSVEKVRTVDDYYVLLAQLEELEARIVELERRLLDRTDGAMH